MSNQVKTGLNKTALQIIAIVAMLIDHLAVFVGDEYIYYYIMKFFGRITIVIMCYFVAEGYYKTNNLGKYIARMGIFAAISQIPYYLYLCQGTIIENPKGLIMSMFNTRNVIFTLFIGLCLLAIIKSNYKAWIKVIATVAALYLVRNSDWDYYAILWILGFGLLRNDRSHQAVWTSMVLVLKIAPVASLAISGAITAGVFTVGMLDLIVMFGGFLAIPLIMNYNGERGANLKWGFYVFYPLHLLILALIMF